jgi:hypothetical protein
MRDDKNLLRTSYRVWKDFVDCCSAYSRCFVSVFEEVITLRCSVKKFTVSLKHTTISISISLSTLVTPELQIFVFAIKFKYFKNSLFYYYYPIQLFNMTFNLCFFSELLPCPPLPTPARRSSQVNKEHKDFWSKAQIFMYFFRLYRFSWALPITGKVQLYRHMDAVFGVDWQNPFNNSGQLVENPKPPLPYHLSPSISLPFSIHPVKIAFSFGFSTVHAD